MRDPSPLSKSHNHHISESCFLVLFVLEMWVLRGISFQPQHGSERVATKPDYFMEKTSDIPYRAPNNPVTALKSAYRLTKVRSRRGPPLLIDKNTLYKYFNAVQQHSFNYKKYE